VLLLAALLSTAHAGWYWEDVGPFWGLAMFCLVVAAGASKFARRILTQKWLVYIGLTSYGIYLIHETAIEVIERSYRSGASQWADFAVGVIGAVAIGVFFSLVAEQPFVTSRFRDALVTRIENLAAAIARILRIPQVVKLRSIAPAIVGEAASPLQSRAVTSSAQADAVSVR
jgi:peptidoglycan/LPS O-acetylase OafA/YrhL